MSSGILFFLLGSYFSHLENGPIKIFSMGCEMGLGEAACGCMCVNDPAEGLGCIPHSLNVSPCASDSGIHHRGTVCDLELVFLIVRGL